MADETVVLNCTMDVRSVDARILSICASTDLSARAGHLQYRYGSLGKAPELVYPNRIEHPAKHFSYKVEQGGRSVERKLTFSRGKYSYIVFDRDSSDPAVEREWAGHGVYVSGPGVAVELKCIRETVEGGLASLLRLGIPKQPTFRLHPNSTVETDARKSGARGSP